MLGQTYKKYTVVVVLVIVIIVVVGNEVRFVTHSLIGAAKKCNITSIK